MNLNISSFIRQKRKDLRFTQDELANKLGVSKATISKWELAQCYPDITMLPNIAELFGCSIDELLGYCNSKLIISKKESGFYGSLQQQLALQENLF